LDKKILLVDDHALFIEGLQYLLETYGVKVIGKAKNGRDALMKTRVLQPDIILMDIRMPEVSGIDALKLIKAEFPSIKIIMLTTSEDDEDIYEAIKYGASGYLNKNTDGQSLISILEDIGNNEVSLFPNIAEKILKKINDSKNNLSKSATREEKEIEIFTKRQIEILDLIAKGITYKEVGDKLGLTERTVKYHMGRMIEQLHLENRSQVLMYAAQNRILE